MIQSFRNKATEQVFQGKFSKRLPAGIQRTARRRLVYLNRAQSLNDIAAIPAHQLEKLGGDRKGQYSIWINRQFRICFKWREGDAHDVEIVDYHK